MYNDFALVYDALNGDADYDKLFANIHSELTAHGIKSGIVLDAGCGTGELTLRLAEAGYNMIGADISPDMLSVLDAKAREKGVNVQLINCDLARLPLCISIDAAVCTFDTLNHLTPKAFESTVKRISSVLKKGGAFIFDMNTPYKHKHVLANYTFEVKGEGVTCIWDNVYNEKLARTRLAITLEYDDGTYAYERFFEYAYTKKHIEAVCKKYGLQIARVIDGETFGDLRAKSNRCCFTAIKK